MSNGLNLPDPKQAWSRILERIYHEDHILYARINNFTTVQAFLATALAFATSTTTTARNISLIVALFGLVLSLFYISLGFRGVRVIQFWRAYLRLLESIPGMTAIDSHLSEFYRLGHPRGPEETELPLAEGLAIRIDTSWWARRSVHDQFPWYLPDFSGTMFIAVGIPILTTSFLGTRALRLILATHRHEIVSARTCRCSPAHLSAPSSCGTPRSGSDSRRAGPLHPRRRSAIG